VGSRCDFCEVEKSESTARPTDPGSHVVESCEFKERCFERKQRRSLQYRQSPKWRRDWPEVIAHSDKLERV
jgi:hypothetical protein